MDIASEGTTHPMSSTWGHRHGTDAMLGNGNRWLDGVFLNPRTTFRVTRLTSLSVSEHS